MVEEIESPSGEKQRPAEAAPAGQTPQIDEPAAATPPPAEAPDQEAPEQPRRPAPEVPPGKHYFWGTGRRKTSVARVRIRSGDGKILVNKREFGDYFTVEKDRNAVLAPLHAAEMLKSWDVWVNVRGGGNTGQAGAIKLGLARAIASALPDMERMLKDKGLMTRDARMKERKKYGQKGARKRFQFSKR